VAVERIAEQDLELLIARETRRAVDSGVAHIRNPSAFQAHLIEVGLHAERVAARLCRLVPPDEAPDPRVAFVAGAWHDGGKIRTGDDFHEISSALDVVKHGIAWRLLQGPVDQVEPLLRRAALAILPGFALFEQWQPGYRPTTSSRAAFEPAYSSLGLSERDLVPDTLDDLVIMYCDMCGLDEQGASQPVFDEHFDDRWTDIEARARREDPALVPVLPAVRGRVYAGCELVNRYLTNGFDAAGLAAFRRRFAIGARPPGDPPGHAAR
jgi:hypothetical protein